MAKASKSSTTVAPEEDRSAQTVGKGRPTPSRREREAANRKPLVGSTPADRKAARARLNEERERQRIGMANGDDRYVPAKDKGQQRRFVRDHVDARWNVGEAMMPVLLIMIVASAFGSTASAYAPFLVLVFVVLFLIDTFVTWMALRRKIVEKFGEMQSGTFWYILMRAFQMRFLRMPKPQVRRGEYPA